MSEQTASATWARILPRLRRNMEELRRYDCQVIEPPNMDVPPHKRGLPEAPELGYSTGTGAPLPGGETVGAPRQSEEE